MTLRNLCLGAFVVTSMLTFAGCQSAPKPEAKRDVAADTAAINALHDQFAAAYNANDAAAVAATYTDDAIMMPENQTAVEGRAAIQAWYGAEFRDCVAKIAFAPVEIQVAGDWAYERGNGTVTLTPKSGKPITESFKYMAIDRRQADASWKYYREIWNSNDPLVAAAATKK